MNHTVSDFIIRIKNASLALRREVALPYSSLAKAVAQVLVKEGYLADVKEEVVEGKKVLKATIKYIRRSPALTDILVISKPSLRVYSPSRGITQKERKRLSTLVVSTSKGVMTGKEAQKQGLGGELLFEIW